ncbi:hypothetical protein [Nocardia sp. NPDC057353]|uniref:hypothetical protein n=1 Tax=Nocardia sp. NPDC057353 TaxID=3346104 RepID=UPI00363C0F76
MTSRENRRPGEPAPDTELLTPRRGAARTTAIVLVGTASIGLTAVAGAYIVSNVPGRTPGNIEAGRAEPEQAAVPPPPRVAAPAGPFAGSALFERRESAAIAGTVQIRPETVEQQPAAAPPAEVVPPAAAAPEPAADRRVRVGPAYVDARVDEPASGGVALTLDTNATFAALTGGRVDPRAVATLRTEIGTGGSVTVTFSDPTLGSHDLRLERTEVPARVST